MTQNTSSAVMAQRHEDDDSLDDFPTPPWATRALLRELEKRGWIHPSQSAFDPAANRGHMVRALDEFFSQVHASDVADYGAGFDVADFLMPLLQQQQCDWAITNPPFSLASEFVTNAFLCASVGVAMLVPTRYLAGQSRYRNVFSARPPRLILQFTERVVMLSSRLVQANVADHLNEKHPGTPASTATDYLWIVWGSLNPGDFVTFSDSEGSTEFDWIAPCRLELERPGDYPHPADGLADLPRRSA